MNKHHHYTTNLQWTGNKGCGTSSYKAFERSHTIEVEGKPQIYGSSDPSFRGDSSKYNPEELFLSSLSSCHMLWYLHLCAVSGVKIIEYSDKATAILEETDNGSGRFIEAVLNPRVTVTDESMVEKALGLHKQANQKCFIANSVNFSVKHNPRCEVDKLAI